MIADILYKDPRNLRDLIKALEIVTNNCESGMFSLDDAYRLRCISIELKSHADTIHECCT